MIMQRVFPPMPEVGHPESYYSRLCHQAEKNADTHAHEAAKVGQYLTLAMDPGLAWEEKLKYFRHALKRHCQPPPFPEDDVWTFYRTLAEFVKQKAGQEALRIASTEDDMYAARLAMGQSREQSEDEAEDFFRRRMGQAEDCPEWFDEADWAQLKMIRDQWI